MKDYFGYQDKVTVVTGASSGMGKATAEMLVDLGAKVYALDWNPCDVPGIEKFVQVNLSQKESIDQAFSNIPEHIDSFFGIAGVSGAKTDFLTTVSIDFIANKYMTEKYLTKRMRKGGSIAYMTSTAGLPWQEEGNRKVYEPIVKTTSWEDTVNTINATGLQYLPGGLGYSFSKMAMNYYTVTSQQVFGPLGIRVNSVLPGSTQTGMKKEFEAMAGGMDNLLSFCGYANRLAESREMAEPIVFLNSAMASYISGELFIVDYGNSAEVELGIRKGGQEVNLEAILAMMKQRF